MFSIRSTALSCALFFSLARLQPIATAGELAVQQPAIASFAPAYGGCDIMSCEEAGCDGCASPCCSCWSGLLSKVKNWVEPSDRCFDDFVSPMIDFVHFEDPRNLTELRTFFVSHKFPATLGPGNIPAGGDIQLIAAQFRIALTDRLSIIAVKDGYVFDNTEGALDGLLDSGWADITAGLKYNFLRDPVHGSLLSAGFTYEIPLGSERTLQKIGDGQFHFFASGGKRLLDGNAHYLTSVGYQLPVDPSVQSTTFHWNNHLDFRLTDRLYLVTENSWWYWADDAENGVALGVSGQDLINLNVTDVEDNNLVTHNVGLKFKPNRGLEIGAAYEFPLTDFKDVIDNRFQLEVILRY